MPVLRIDQTSIYIRLVKLASEIQFNIEVLIHNDSLSQFTRIVIIEPENDNAVWRLEQGPPLYTLSIAANLIKFVVRDDFRDWWRAARYLKNTNKVLGL